MKNNNIVYIAIIIISIVALAIGTYNPIVSSEGNTKLVRIGEAVILKKGQTAKIKDRDVHVTITDLIYSPCPEGAQCIWSGLDVVYELYINGEKVNNYGSKYEVIIMQTDYKKYAKIKIIEAG